MPVITVVGPSHAGKSVLVSLVTSQPTRYGLPASLVSVNLDEELGSASRSDGAKAIEIIDRYGRMCETLVVDCGAGQLAFSSDFRSFIERNSMASVVVWCDVDTFRTRHSVDEIPNNYRADLLAIWNLARDQGRLVDTSAGISPEQSAIRLASVITDIIQPYSP
jgi:hypothetical protein